LNLLAALEALLDERHVTHAGERLEVTQSAMSGALRRLRKHFNDELLVRSGNDLVLTPLAESLIPLVREARRSTDRLFSAGGEFDPTASTRHFTIAASDFVQATLAPGLARLLTEAAPRVRGDFVPLRAELVREPQYELLKFDLVILPPSFLTAYRHTSELLFRDDFVCVIAAAHPAAAPGGPTAEQLAAIPMVTASLGLTHQHIVPLAQLLLSRSSAELRPPTVEVSSYLAVPAIVREGLHWALVPRRLATTGYFLQGCVMFEPPFATESFSEAMFWHASRAHDPALLWLRGIVRQALTFTAV
jgi:DNA-binding transcriptional LysR family regulator